MASQPKGRFAAYRQTLAAIAARTGTPLPSLILSFGILHELTAIVPLVSIFYGSRALGVGERIVSAIIEDKLTNYEASTHDKTQLSWGKQKLESWVEEGDRWAIKVGRRYGIFGYEKRMPGTVDDVEEMARVTGHIAGDVANAVLAYGATKYIFLLYSREQSSNPYERPSSNPFAVIPEITATHPIFPQFCYFPWILDSADNIRPRILSHERYSVFQSIFGFVLSSVYWDVYKMFINQLPNTIIQGFWVIYSSLSRMTKNKLNLKRTPEEELQHRLRKERRRAKRRHSSHGDFKPQAKTSSKRSHANEQEAGPSRKWASSDEDDEAEYGPQPANISTNTKSHAQESDYDALKTEIEQEMFRQKMFDDMGDDERLDSIEAQFNDFAQVPDRWRTSGMGKNKANVYEEDGYVKMDPRYMDDEEYAEWIRVGMYRKTHAEEYAERERKKAAKAARQEEEKARKIETARLENAAEVERKRRRLERESRRLDYAREQYGVRWRALLSITGESKPPELGFNDIPWPVSAAQRHKPNKANNSNNSQSEVSISTKELTVEAITAFLVPAGKEDREKRKEKLRESILRFHPDKFEGRFMRFVKDSEKERVQEAIGLVSRVLNALMSE